jgi:fused signal recognition particle receptor
MDTSIIIIVFAVVILGAVLVGFLVLGRNRESDTVATEPPSAPPRTGLGAAIRRALGASIDAETWVGIEEAMIAADVGVAASADIAARARQAKPETVDEARSAIADSLKEELSGKNRELQLSGSPAVVLVVGVNGTGKTTTIAKLAKRLLDGGRTVTLGGADTYRAAAAEQLETWGERLGVRVIRGQEGSDPASVAYDTIDSARARGVDVVIIDTAGRLHGKKNLMSELQKIHRVSGGESVGEVLLILDATTGQNGLTQVSEFSQAVPISGIVLTKLDGTARGGIVIAVERTLGVPVKFVGVGEGPDDLQPFDPGSFVEALIA